MKLEQQMIDQGPGFRQMHFRVESLDLLPRNLRPVVRRILKVVVPVKLFKTLTLVRVAVRRRIALLGCFLLLGELRLLDLLQRFFEQRVLLDLLSQLLDQLEPGQLEQPDACCSIGVMIIRCVWSIRSRVSNAIEPAEPFP